MNFGSLQVNVGTICRLRVSLGNISKSSGQLWNSSEAFGLTSINFLSTSERKVHGALEEYNLKLCKVQAEVHNSISLHLWYWDCECLSREIYFGLFLFFSRYDDFNCATKRALNAKKKKKKISQLRPNSIYENILNYVGTQESVTLAIVTTTNKC